MATADKDKWITAKEAAEILTKNTDHEISADYVRMLAKSNKIVTRAIDGRTNVYLRADVEGYVVRKKNAPRVRPRPTTRKEAGEQAESAA